MSFLERNANSGSVSTGYDIDNSIKLEVNNNEWLYRNSPTAGNRKTFTLSLWLKRAALGHKPAGDDEYLAGQGSSARFHFAGDTLRFMFAGNSTELESSRVYRDASAWYHIVLAVDTTQGTNTNRVKLYINGVQESWNNSDWPGQNTESDWMNTNDLYIGTKWGNNSTGDGDNDLSGYLSEVVLLDGTAASPTSFGEFDDNGIWKPVDVSGLTFGSEGFYANFDDSSALGADSSGNGNTLSLSNIAAADQATDTPTNNFCTWSPLWAEPRANGTITEGATQVAWGGSAWKIARSSMAVSKGRWYWEIKAANVTGDTWNNNLFGFASVEGDNGQYGPMVLLGYSTGNYYYRVANSQTGSDDWGDAGGAWSSSDTFGLALDLESSTKKFILYRNGSAVNGSGTNLVSAFQTEQFFTTYSTAYNGDTQFLNWGGYTVNTISSAASDANGYGTFEYAPPTGYYSLCSKNLSEFGG